MKHERNKMKSEAGEGSTLASRALFVMLCVALIFSALAFGSNMSWSLALFQAGAGCVVVLWAGDAWLRRRLIISRNFLQLPLIALVLFGLVQIVPFGMTANDGEAFTIEGLIRQASATVSLNPYATRMALVRVVALLIYFAAALAFIDSPRRLRRSVLVITIFGVALALEGMIQAVVSPDAIYGFRSIQNSKVFGTFFNSHHFAGYMELALAPALGLVFTGAVERERRLLYGFAALLMGIALLMTGSRGAMLSVIGEIGFLAFITGRINSASVADEATGDETDAKRRVLKIKRTLAPLALAASVLVVVIAGVIVFGGDAALDRIVGTVNRDDPTNGRTHFWAMTVESIRAHPFTGTGLGAFPFAYTRHDTANGLFRVEQAHNDYLQVLADTGIVGSIIAVAFFVMLFRTGLKRVRVADKYRCGVAAGALAGCVAVLIHSFFDFTLQTTANALLFFIIVALATLDTRVEEKTRRKKRSRREVETEADAKDEAVMSSASASASPVSTTADVQARM